MSSLASVVRLTTHQNVLWRHCKRCDVLAPLPPDETHCLTCRQPASAARRRLPRAA